MEKYLDMKNEIIFDKLKEPASIIKNDGIVLFPTETVYGIGANGLSSTAVEKVYKAKGRSTKNPINLLVSGKEMIESIAKDITELEYKLMEAFFPGPFTIILKRKDEEAGVPIAAPSANLSGKPSGTNLNDIIEEFEDKVDYIIDGGDSQIGLESTIVKVVEDVPHILRPGAITDVQIKEIAGDVILDYLKKTNNVLLPSNSMEHYRTSSRCVY